jgi:P63C domain-containing protein
MRLGARVGRGCAELHDRVMVGLRVNRLELDELWAFVGRRRRRLVRGYDASVLVAVCNVWLKAREARALQTQQLGKAQKAEILTRALAQTGIVALVDEATGYEKVRPQNALQEFLAIMLRKELAAWVKKFPDEFYENIYKLKGWKWPGMSKNRYSVVGHYTNNLVFDRLAPGLLRELRVRSPKDEKGRRDPLHLWRSEDVGDPMLAQHLYTLMMFQRLAIANGHGWNRFLHTVDQVLPRRGDTLPLPFEESGDEAAN